MNSENNLSISLPGFSPPDSMGAMPISVSIVEDNPGTRNNLVVLLNSEPQLRLLNAYASGEEAVRGILPVAPPDVVVVDIKLPGMSGIECVAKLKAEMPGLRVLILTTYQESDLIFNCLRAGANGYLLKEMPAEELIQAIQEVHSGGAPMSMQIARKVVDHFHRIKQPASDLDKLTPREQEVLALLAKGFLYKEISDQLGISFHTLRNHQRSIYEKLHVHSRMEAALKYLGEEQKGQSQDAV
jgi:DNA-binding NarL/FixJ family response regulator